MIAAVVAKGGLEKEWVMVERVCLKQKEGREMMVLLFGVGWEGSGVNVPS